MAASDERPVGPSPAPQQAPSGPAAPAHPDETIDLRADLSAALGVGGRLGAAEVLNTIQGQPRVAFPRPAHSDPVQIGPYRILERLGEGGMGVVYKAEQRHPVRRVVALKVIKLGMDTKEVVARFEAERQALAMLSHPNVARVLDAGITENGRPYFAMEHVPGVSLTQYCDEYQFTTRQRLDIFIPICQAVQHAHQKGIIHRDLKPTNILVTLADGQPVPKVIDFGIAKATNHALTQHTLFTQTGALIGTPEYMSPEQAQSGGLDVDTRTDIFSLGVILYELLTGTLPLEPKSLREAGLDGMARMIRTSEPQRPSTRLMTPASSTKPGKATGTAGGRTRDPRTIQKELRGDLDWVVMKAIEKDRSRRYETANALAMDIKRHTSNEPVNARPPSAAYRLQKAFHRNRLAFAATGLVLAALVAGACVSAWQAVRATRAEAQARANEAKANRSATQARQSQHEAELAHAASQRMSAGLALDRGLQLCQDGKVPEGLLWMAESLAVNPEGDRGFADVVRLSLAAWRATLTVQRTIIAHERAVNCVAYSPDGKTFVTAEGGAVRRWDAATGEQVGQGFTQPGVVFSVAFSPDGRLLATGSGANEVWIWDLASGQAVGRPIPQPDLVNALAFSPDGRLLVAAAGYRNHSAPGSARVWEVATGEPAAPLLPHAHSVWGAGFSPDGRFVITAAHDGVVRYWETATGRLEDKTVQVQPTLLALATSRDGSFLATGSFGGEAHVASGLERRNLSPALRMEGPVPSVAFHPGGGMIATGCYDGRARLWDWSSGKTIGPPLVHQNYVLGVGFSPDGRRLITGSEDKTARIWDLPLQGRKGIPLAQSDPALSLGHFEDRVLSGRPRTRITGDRGRPVPHWVLEYLCASFSPDGRHVVTGSVDKSARVWEVATGRLVGPPLPHQNWVRAVAFAPDNRRVLTGSHDMTARVWDVATSQPLTPPLRHAGELIAVAISPDGKRGLTGSADKTARLWDLDTGEPVGPPMPHPGRVWTVGFSNDGRFVLTSNGEQGEVRLWDAVTATAIGPPARHDRAVTAARFDDDGRSFLTLGDDGAARRWPVPQPVAGEPGLIRLWAQSITGQELDAGKAVSVLDTPAWRERRARLMGSPLAADLDDGREDALAWHDAAAGADEILGQVEPAFWHLDRLLAARPGDWSLHARRAGLLRRGRRDAEALKELDLARELGGLAPVRAWCAARAEGFERTRQNEEAIWFRGWIAAAAPGDATAHNDLGHCHARLGRFAEAGDLFTRAAALAPDRVGYQRDLAMARLGLGDRAGYRKACARMIELAEATEDREAAHLAALTCVLDAGAVPQWDAVVRLAARAAEGYDGDHRVHVAALFRAGRIAEALERPWSTETRYAKIFWEWYLQGMLRLRAGRHEEARSIFAKLSMDFMDQAAPRDPTSKVWSDWIYHVQCHALRSEAEALMAAARAGTPPTVPLK